MKPFMFLLTLIGVVALLALAGVRAVSRLRAQFNRLREQLRSKFGAEAFA